MSVILVSCQTLAEICHLWGRGAFLPNKNILDHQMWRFLQAPYDEKADTSLYNKNVSDWKTDIHLSGTYVFLGQDERRIMASEQHNILITQLYTYNFLDVSGSQIVEIESKDMIKDYMWRFRRNDAYLRNEWSNYTNWPYNNVKPMQVSLFSNESINIESKDINIHRKSSPTFLRILSQNSTQ